MRKSVLFVTSLFVALLVMASCAGAQKPAEGSASTASSLAASSAAATTPALEKCPVSPDADFGHVYIDVTINGFNDLGFVYGDSVNVSFSNGYQITVPYYSGYYGKVGERMLVAYPGYPFIVLAENCGSPMWETAGVSEGDTATVTLDKASAFIDVQNSFNITYSDERSDYASDVAFANYRAASGGSIAQNVVYRSASPVNDEHNRSGYVNALMKDSGVQFVLNLSDDDAEMDEAAQEAAAKGVDQSYFAMLRERGAVAGVNLGANYPSESYAKKLAAGLVEMSQHDGPYLVHCVEGKDRTGYVCMLLEALAGTPYDEMLADYMTTYDNYYGITRESDAVRYETIAVTNFDCMLEHLIGEEGVDLTNRSYEQPARDYLKMGGMTGEQIDALVARITNSDV